MFTVFSALRSCFDPRKRHPVKTADAGWCQPVFVLSLPNSRSTPERADGQAELIARRWRAVVVPVIAAFVITASASGGHLAWTTRRDRVVHEQIVCAPPGSGNVELASGRFASGEHETIRHSQGHPGCGR